MQATVSGADSARTMSLYTSVMKMLPSFLNQNICSVFGDQHEIIIPLMGDEPMNFLLGEKHRVPV